MRSVDAKEQYRDSSKLKARAGLHKYGRRDWYPWFAGHAGFEADDKVLDIGCGTGWFWSQVPVGLDVTLGDQSEGMVAEALQRVQEWKRFLATGIVCDVCALPFEDGCFDKVMAMHMLYHAEDPRLGVQEIARVLRPGGVALISTNGVGNMRAMYQFGHLAFGGSPTEPVAPIFGLEMAPEILSEHFDAVRFERFEDALVCTEPDGICAALTSFPPGDKANPDQLRRLRELVGVAISDGGGQIIIAKDVGVFVCTKN